jgi:hypothetical protein
LVLYNWLVKACELITNDDVIILVPYLRHNVFNKTHTLDAVFDLPESNQSNNKDNGQIKQVPTFQKVEMLKDSWIPLVDMPSPLALRKTFEEKQISAKTKNFNFT